MIKGVLLDLGGVVYVGDRALAGAVAAIERLRQADLPLRYLTNTTRSPRRALIEKLGRLGVVAGPEEIFTPALAARRYLERRGLRPHLLVHPAIEPEFSGLDGARGKAVVIGDAAEAFTYDSLNRAYRALEAGADFLALARNRSFHDADDELSLDAGPFVAALEFACGRRSTVLGKPAAGFFAEAIASLGCDASDAVMVGDDVEADVAGAIAVGLAGVLVRTGKYRPGCEADIDPPPTQTVDDLPAAVDWILSGTDRPGAG